MHTMLYSVIRRPVYLFLICAVVFYCTGCGKTYSTIDITYRGNDIQLSGRVYLPEGEGPFPGVVIVPSAEPDTKEVFEEYAEYFAANGIVTLCYDKRGAGNSTGNIQLAGFDELLSDALAGVAQLKQIPQADANAIGLLGHSQGGMYIFKPDSANNRVAFVIDFSGSPGTPLKQSHYNIRSKIIDHGGDELFAEQLATLMDDYIVYLHKRENYDSIKFRHDALLSHPQRPVADKINYFAQFTYLKPPTQLPPHEEMEMYPFMRSYDYQSADYIPSLTSPALFVYGKKDKVIPSWECIQIVKTLQQVNPRVDLKVYEQAGHSMKENTLTGQQFPDGYLEFLSNWIKKNTQNL